VFTVEDGRLGDFNAQAYAASLGQLAEKVSAQIVLFQQNYNGMAVAPRVAARLGAGMVSGVMAQPSSVNPFVVKRKVFSGKAFANVEIESERKVLALSQNSFGLHENLMDCDQSAFVPELSDRYFTLKVESVERTKGKVPVTEAELIVSGGRGLKGPENWHLVENLAELIGASTACSKPVADIEWRPHYEHVGQTGKFVSPNLYIAIGISGAIQHLAGISSSKVIVAINTDPEAPFFEVADYGIVGDAFVVVPKLTEAIRQIKNK
jgi:electron transfer flavoprotein alpha subunit